ncbi:MAG: hypothetical protein AAGA99_05260 [Actinomycetota bacterium]
MRSTPTRYRGAVVAAALIVVGCSSGGSDGASHCDHVEAAVAAGAFDDELLEPTGGPQALREQLTAVLEALDRAAASAPDDLSADWRLLADALGDADEALASYGYDLVALATTGTAEEAQPLVAAGGDAVTELRVDLVDDITTRCAVDVDRPTSALGLPDSDEVVIDDLDPRVVDPRQLPPERLAGLLARTFEIAELEAAFDAAGVDSVSELADVLLDGSRAESRALLDQLVDRVRVSERGDDPRLDALWDACVEDGDSACDLLGFISPAGSAYEAIALSCGGRVETPGPASCSEQELR